MTNLPEPPIDSEVDLTDFSFMPLNVRQLRDSRFAASSDGESFRAAVLLWCASWHQSPAGSVPDDDVELATLAGYGRMVKEWQKVRTGALYGWRKCNDGRLYHPIVVEKAKEAWGAKLETAYRRELDRLRKENKRRAENKEPALHVPSFDDWNSERRSRLIPPDVRRNSSGTLADAPGNSEGRPADSVLKGQGRDREGTRKGQGHVPPPRLPPESARTHQSFFDWMLELKAVYPNGTYEQVGWQVAERDIVHHIDELGATRAEIRAGVDRYMAQCVARGDVIGTQFVKGPLTFFDRNRPLFREPFPIPATKAQVSQDADIAAGQAWLARSVS